MLFDLWDRSRVRFKGSGSLCTIVSHFPLNKFSLIDVVKSEFKERMDDYGAAAATRSMKDLSSKDPSSQDRHLIMPLMWLFILKGHSSNNDLLFLSDRNHICFSAFKLLNFINLSVGHNISCALGMTQ
jgi:hypothetical protein